MIHTCEHCNRAFERRIGSAVELAEHEATFHCRVLQQAKKDRPELFDATNFAKPQPLVMSSQDLAMYKRDLARPQPSYSETPADGALMDFLGLNLRRDSMLRADVWVKAHSHLFSDPSPHWTSKLPGPRGFPRYCVHYTGTPLEDLCWRYRKLAKAERPKRRTWGDWMADQWWPLRMPDVVAEAQQHEPRLPCIADSRGVGWSPPWIDEDEE